MMQATISPSLNTNTKPNKLTRSSSLPSETTITTHRRPKIRDVASRYLDTTLTPSSKRCQSPTTITKTNRPSTPSSTIQPQSTERRQSVTPRRDSLDRLGNGDVTAEQRILLNSGRNLLSTFQEDSYPCARKGTLDKKKVSEQWPRSLKPNCLNRSIDLNDDRKKLSGSYNRDFTKPLAGNKLPASGIVVKARFNSPTAIDVPRKFYVDMPKREQVRPASPRGMSPLRGVIPPPRGISSPSGRMSPLRVRNNIPLVMNFVVDGKKDNKIRDNGVGGDAHLLRIMHNKLLQWRFANARADAVISTQKKRAERSLYNAMINISKLNDSVRAKRIEMHNLKQNLKLVYILIRQMVHLEEWIVVERDCVSSIVEAAEALKASTLCQPVDCGAIVNVQSLKDAICSAIDLMQAMASSICLLPPKVGRINCLAGELDRVIVKEKWMLEIFWDLLNRISALQVKECSLRTQFLQLQY